jgi:hypothetical protein
MFGKCLYVYGMIECYTRGLLSLMREVLRIALSCVYVLVSLATIIHV